MSQYFSESSDTAPIALKKRLDIIVREVSYQGEPYWICKDPLDQEYHHLNEQEFAILKWLDGKTSFDELQARFEIEFTPYRINLNEIAQTIGGFHEKSLVVATDSTQGEVLLEMGREKNRKDLKQKFMSVWAIKWKGFDPEVFLNATNPYVRWYFSRYTVVVVLLMVLMATVWLALHYEQAMARAPSLANLFGPSNLLTLAVVFTLTKLCHEFGHAYAFKRFGGEVHEIGIMIFFFMPTMYCNTSDSWLLKDKWARIAIALGGVYIELTIFFIATFVWWFSSTGFVQDFAVNLMFVCSLSTVVVNGNPLLKYDGYFVLADLVEIPNLAQQSSDQISRNFMVHALGIKDQELLWVSRSNKRFMIAYGIAAYLFRMSLMVSVAYFLVLNAASIGLAPVGFIFSVAVTLVYIAKPPYELWKKLKAPGTIIKIKRKNLVATSLIASALAVGLFIPFPFYVGADCTMDDGDSGTVVNLEAGTLTNVFFAPGDRVQRGDLIVRLSNPTLEKELLKAERELAIVNVEIDNSKHDLYQSNGQPQFRTQLKKAESLESQCEHLARRCEALNVVAACDGIVLGIKPDPKESPMNDERSLKSVHGNLLVTKDLTWLEVGTEICRIRSSGPRMATLAFKQSDQDLIAKGQQVYLLFNSDRSTKHSGIIESLSQESESHNDLFDFEKEGQTVQTIASASSNGQQKGAPINQDGGSLDSAFLLGKCEIDQSATLLFGSNGAAKVYVGRRSAAWRINRMIRLFINTKL